MTKVQEKLNKINQDFMKELRIGMTEEQIIDEELFDIIDGITDYESRSDKIMRWKNTIDNINQNLKTNHEYPEELVLLLLEDSAEQANVPTVTIDECIAAIDAYTNPNDYKEYEYEYEYDDEYEDEYEYDDDLAYEPTPVYVERVVPKYKEPARKPWGFWKTTALTAGTAYVSYKAGVKLGKSLM